MDTIDSIEHRYFVAKVSIVSIPSFFDTCHHNAHNISHHTHTICKRAELMSKTYKNGLFFKKAIQKSKNLYLYGQICTSGNTVLQATAVKWTNRFRNGRNSVEDDAREGRPKTTHNAANTDRIQSFIDKDRHLTTSYIAEGTNIDRETVRKILLEDLGMHKVFAEMVPKILAGNKKRFVFNCVKNG